MPTIDDILIGKKVMKAGIELKDKLLDDEKVLVSYALNLTREEQRKYARIAIFSLTEDLKNDSYREKYWRYQ